MSIAEVGQRNRELFALRDGLWRVFAFNVGKAQLPKERHRDRRQEVDVSDAKLPRPFESFRYNDPAAAAAAKRLHHEDGPQQSIGAEQFKSRKPDRRTIGRPK
jgi:hypothetical protein